MLLPDINAPKLLLQRLKAVVEGWGNARRYFFAFDKAGGQTIPTDWTDLAFDTKEICDNDLFRFGNGVLTVLSACRVEIECEITAETSGDRRYFGVRIIKDVGNGFSEVSCARSYGYCRISTVPYGFVGVRRIMNVAKDTKIKIQGISSDATEVTTTANCCRFSVRRVIYGD